MQKIEDDAYENIFLIFFISIILIWLSNLLSRVRAEHSTTIKNKNTLIEEATSIKNALNKKGLELLSEFEVECYNTALSRLKTLNSYKKTTSQTTAHF